MTRRSVWLGATALLSATTALPAQAQTADDNAVEPAAPIVVTIKRPGDTLLDAPVSGDTFDRAELDNRQYEDLTSLAFAAPNVSLDTIGTFRGVANFAIRGLGINSSIPSIDPAVGLFVDGVYIGVNAGAVFEGLDVQSVTVLRGPQGVAFGRNTTGGAVLVETGDPAFEAAVHADLAFEAPIDGGRGAPMAIAKAVATAPLSDRLAIRLAALHTIDGGYFRNRFDDSDFGETQTTILRGGLTFRASDRLTLTAKGEWHDSDGDGAPGHNNGQIARNSFDIALDQRGFYRSKAKFAMLRAELEVAGGLLTNVAGWREYELFTRNDIDSSPVKVFESDTGTVQDQWSNELYYFTDTGPVALTAGGYLFHQDIAYQETRDLSAFALPTFYGGGRQGHDVYGLYANADVPLSPAITLTAGLRWSREEKDAEITYVRPRDECSVIDRTCAFTGERVPGENNGLADKRSWDSFSPRLALSYDVAPAALAYASWTRGFRSGGYNLRVTQPAAFEDVATRLGSAAFDEERVDTFEIGAKLGREGGRLVASAALFWSEVDDMQREVNVASATAGLAQSVYNTADARIRGGEVEASFAVSPMLTLNAHAGHVDADYRDVFFDISGDGAVGPEDAALALPRVPEWTYGAGFLATVPMNRATLIARADFQHRDPYAYTDNNFGFVDAIDMLDASVGIAFSDPGLSITFYGKNLLDEVQFGGDTQLGFAGGPLSDGTDVPFDPRPAVGTFSPIMKGRRIGLSVAMDF